jgi:hypothetical protein
MNVPIVSKSPEEATNHFSWFAHFAALDNPSSSERTRELFRMEAEAGRVDFRYRPAKLFRKQQNLTKEVAITFDFPGIMKGTI